MKVVSCKPGDSIPYEVRGLVSTIQRRQGDCEGWLKSYNKSPYDFTWYGYPMIIEILFTTYGTIGYSIEYRGYEVRVDNEYKQIDIEKV